MRNSVLTKRKAPLNLSAQSCTNAVQDIGHIQDAYRCIPPLAHPVYQW